MDPDEKSITLCATLTSIPSRLRTTVHPAIKVSAISLVSSILFGLITQTSIAAGAGFLFAVRIGVTLEELSVVFVFLVFLE